MVKFFSIALILLLTGCACGTGSNRGCVTGYTQTQTQPGVWVTTVQYGN